jgi:membrane fusion protein (multidrug efflux system)
VGQPKSEVTKNEMLRINPFAEVYTHSSTDPDEITRWLDADPTPHVIVDEVDDIASKLMLRRYARARHLPLVMVTDVGDNVMLDVERYDREPQPEPFLGMVPDIEQVDFRHISDIARLKMVVGILGLEGHAEEMLDSMAGIGRDLGGAPQLGPTATAAGGIAALAIKKIRLGEDVRSGRYWFSTDRTLVADIDGLQQVAGRERGKAKVRKTFGIDRLRKDQMVASEAVSKLFPCLLTLRRVGKRTLLVCTVFFAITAAGIAGTNWWLTGRHIISTDDAYVRAHNTTLASKISGYVVGIPVADNAPVRADEVIATIDDGDFRLAVDAARAKVATQEATIDRIGRQIVTQTANIDQAEAQMRSAQADAKKTQLEYERQQALAVLNHVSRQSLEQAVANRDRAAAGVEIAHALIDSAKANLDVLKARQQEATRTLDELKTMQAKAERDLSFTLIRAPVDGVFGNRMVQTGDYVQTGQRIASLVPLNYIYIEANFKETQLARIQPGQEVSISVDALPNNSIEGRVVSLSPASGAVFSVLPPENATGNFTKVVQRLPVRIEVPASVAAQSVLRPGMSVFVSVNTKPSPVMAAGLTTPVAARIR